MKKQAGLPIDRSQSALIRAVVEERLRERQETRDPTPRYIFVVRTSTVNFFEVRRRGQIITTPSETNAAAFLTLDLAQQCERALKELGTPAFFDRFTNAMGRKQSTLTTDVSQVGLGNTE